MSIDDAYKKWRSSPTKENMSEIIFEAKPLLYSEAYRIGGHNELLMAESKRLAVDAIKRFEPDKGAKLSSWLVTNMQGLSRYKQQKTTPLKIPEVSYRQAAMVNAERDKLRQELGDEPTEFQIADSVGMSVKKVKRLESLHRKLLREGQASAGDDDDSSTVSGSSLDERHFDNAKALVYAELDDIDKKIFEWSTGELGIQLSNKEIANRLRITPSAVSQRNKAIAERILFLADHDKH